VKKSEELKPKRKNKFKYFLLAHILTLFFVAGNFSFAAGLPDEKEGGIFGSEQKNYYSEPFSKLIEFLNAKKKEIENYGENSRSEKSFLKKNDFRGIGPANESDFTDMTADRTGSSFLLSAVLEPIKDAIIDKPKQYFGKVFCATKDFVFPGTCRDVADQKGENVLSSRKDSFGAGEIGALKRQYEDAINEASVLNQKFNQLQSEISKVKAGGIVVREPVIEQKTVERTIEKIISGLSQNDLDVGISSVRNELNNLNTNLLNKINTLSIQAADQNTAVYRAVSLTNKIDSLSGTRLSNITVSGVTGLTDADIPDTVTASNYLPLAGGTISGNLTVDGSTTLGSLTLQNATASYFTATSTTASTFPYASTTAISATTASTTNLIVSNNSTLGTVVSGIWNGATIGVGYGGTGQTSFGQGWLNSDGTAFSASTSPTVNYLTATSTTATSTFAGGLSVAGLSVAGHCVTGDTRLRRRRKKKKGEGYEYDEVAIKDIREGDEIASLDEETGRIVWSKVNALMDMGMKEIYKLTTASGKTIRTTAEHPYLARNQKISQVKSVAFIDYANIKAWMRGKGLSADLEVLYSTLKEAGVSDIRFYYGADAKNGKIQSFFAKLSSFGYAVVTKPVQYFKIALSELLKQQANTRWLEAIGSPIKTSLLNEAAVLDKNGIELFAPKANFDVEIAVDALKRTKNIDMFIIFSGDGDFACLLKVLRALGKKVVVVSGRKSLSGALIAEADKFVTLERLGEKVPGLFANAEKQNPPRGRVLRECAFNIADLLGLSSRPVDNFVAVKNGSWTKVAYLKEGMEIAVSDAGADRAVWDRIAKIEILPEEQVYDIEVDGTHNFIGNDIVAHNTYLGSLNGPLQANSGLVSATTSMGYQYGGTGLTSTPSFGQLLRGTGSGYSLVATSTLGINTGDLTEGANLFWTDNRFDNRLSATTSLPNLTTLANLATVGTITSGIWNGTTIAVNKGGTGQTSFGQGWLNSDGAAFSASTSPTVNYLTATSTTATSTFPYLSVTTNSNLGTVVGGVWQGTAIGDTYLTKSGDWTGTLDTYEAANLLARANHTGTQAVSTLSNYDFSFANNYGTNNLISSTTMPWWAQGGINASSTSHFVNASTTALTVSGNSYLGTVSSGTWNGTAIGDAYLDDTITLTNLTQITNRAISDTSGTLTVARGGTGQTSFGQGWLNSDGTAFSASTSPTVNYLTATSTTATSTFATGGLTVGTNQFVVQQNSGNVGIGTTTPSARLHIQPETGTNSELRLDTSSWTDIPYLSFFTNSVATSSIQTRSGGLAFQTGGGAYSANTKMVINSTGNIGIGTTSPYAMLSVAGEVVGQMFTATSTTATSTFAGGMSVAGTAGLTVLQNGKVGIGTTTPGAKLHIAESNVGAIGEPLRLENTSAAAFTGSDVTFRFAGTEYSKIRVNNLGDTFYSMRFFVYGSGAQAEKMTLLGNGNLGLGTTTPLRQLSIFQGGSTAATSPSLLFAASSTAAMWTANWTMGADLADAGKFKIASSTVLGSSDRFVIDGKGNVGIGTTTPWRTLSVTGTVGFSSSLSATTTNAYDLCIDAATFEVTQRTTDCSGASSLRYKQNVEKLSYGLEDLMKLNPVSFQYTEAFAPTDRKRKIGFIAEEMAPLIPEIVAYDDLGRPDSIDYPKLTSVLVKAMQEMNLKVSDLQASVAASSGTGTDSLFAWILDKFKTILGISFENGAVKANKICVGETCVTEEQFKAVFGATAASSVSNSSSSSSETSSSSAESSSSSSSSSSESSESSSSSSSSSSSESSSSAADGGLTATTTSSSSEEASSSSLSSSSSDGGSTATTTSSESSSSQSSSSESSSSSETSSSTASSTESSSSVSSAESSS